MAHRSTGGSHTFICWSSLDEIHGEQRRGKRTVPGGALGVKTEWGIERLSQVGSTPALFRHFSEPTMRRARLQPLQRNRDEAFVCGVTRGCIGFTGDRGLSRES